MIHRRDVLRTVGLGTAASIFLGTQSTRAAAPRPSVPLVPDIDVAQNSAIWACWIGHATVLLKIGDAWVLTDPILSDAYGVSILGMTLGPRRIQKPALTIDMIPRPDLILLSHAHLDHMDRPTLSALSERYPGQIDVVTAANTRDVITDLQWRSLNEMDWGEKKNMHGFALTCLQVKHNGWRWPGEACRAGGQLKSGRSFNGYYLSYNGVGVVFGGDTAYTESFRNVPGPVDLAMMPIGAYGSCPSLHCTPEEALSMANLMNARYILPIHHSTFNQVEEPLSEPLQRLFSVMKSTPSPFLALHQSGGSIHLA